MAKNKHLNIARNEKRDSFFTLYEDIEKELRFYDKDHFKGKVVYCNCDTDQSNFFKYFVDYFEELGLKKLIATGISKDWDIFYGDLDGKAYKIEYYGKEKGMVKTELRGDDDDEILWGGGL